MFITKFFALYNGQADDRTHFWNICWFSSTVCFPADTCSLR